MPKLSGYARDKITLPTCKPAKCSQAKPLQSLAMVHWQLQIYEVQLHDVTSVNLAEVVQMVPKRHETIHKMSSGSLHSIVISQHMLEVAPTARVPDDSKQFCLCVAKSHSEQPDLAKVAV